jgi:sporulation protein YlmC with PRC-barrel domain
MGTEQSFPAARLVASNSSKGTPVYAPEGNRLGRIEHVMIDGASGEIVYAVVEFGSANAIVFGTDRHQVPWSLLAYNPRFEGYELRITERTSRRE